HLQTAVALHHDAIIRQLYDGAGIGAEGGRKRCVYDQRRYAALTASSSSSAPKIALGAVRSAPTLMARVASSRKGRPPTMIRGGSGSARTALMIVFRRGTCGVNATESATALGRRLLTMSTKLFVGTVGPR